MQYVIKNRVIEITGIDNISSAVKRHIESELNRGRMKGVFKRGTKTIYSWNKVKHINYIHKLYAEANN